MIPFTSYECQCGHRMLIGDIRLRLIEDIAYYDECEPEPETIPSEDTAPGLLWTLGLAVLFAIMVILLAAAGVR